jgi:hypothetical protein
MLEGRRFEDLEGIKIYVMKELLALMQISSKIVYSNFMSEHRSA